MESIEQRLIRIESRLVQIMLHLDLDPYKKMYSQFDKAKPRENPDDKKPLDIVAKGLPID